MSLPTRAQVRELYFGESSYALRFQAVWIIFDLAVIAFFIIAPFVPHTAVFYAFDYLIALLLLADMVLRAWSYGDIKRWLKRPLFWADLAVLLSLIVPFYGINLGFLRALSRHARRRHGQGGGEPAGLCLCHGRAGTQHFRRAGCGHRFLHRLALFHRYHAYHHRLW